MIPKYETAVSLLAYELCELERTNGAWITMRPPISQLLKISANVDRKTVVHDKIEVPIQIKLLFGRPTIPAIR